MKAAFRRSCFTCLALVGAFAISVGGASAQQPVKMTIASFSQGSGWYVYAVNLAELLRQSLRRDPRLTRRRSPARSATSGSSPTARRTWHSAWRWSATGRRKGSSRSTSRCRTCGHSLAAGTLLPGRRRERPRFGPGMDKFLEKDRPNGGIALLPRGGVGPFGGQQCCQLLNAGEDAVKQRGGKLRVRNVRGDQGQVREPDGRSVHQPRQPRASVVHGDRARNNAVTFLQPPQSIARGDAEALRLERRRHAEGHLPDAGQDLRVARNHHTLFTSTRMPADMAYGIVKTICEKTDRLQAAAKALAKFDCAGGVWREEVNWGWGAAHGGRRSYYASAAG